MNKTIIGTIIHGAGEGKKIGFPTANLDTPADKIDAEHGIYAGQVTINNTAHSCAVIIRPHNSTTRAEVHLLDHNENLYGKNILVTLFEKIRPWEQFNNATALQKQISADIATVQSLLENR